MAYSWSPLWLSVFSTLPPCSLTLHKFYANKYINELMTAIFHKYIWKEIKDETEIYETKTFLSNFSLIFS